MTMHDEWTDRLSDYLDDELSDQERRAVAAHLAECPDCAHTLDELRAVVIAAQSVTPSVPPIDLWDRVATRIASSRRMSYGSRAATRSRLSVIWMGRTPYSRATSRG